MSTLTVTQIDNPSGLEQCDHGGCPANGLWRITFPTGDLVFCGNHAVADGFVPRTTSHGVYETYIEDITHG